MWLERHGKEGKGGDVFVAAGVCGGEGLPVCLPVCLCVCTFVCVFPFALLKSLLHLIRSEIPVFCGRLE